MMRSALVGVAAAATVLGQNVQGPGPGPWETATPESEGLSTSALNKAASDTADFFNGAANRYCYLVVKNGKIVHEQYYDGRTETSKNDGWSTTKSMCSTMFGIASQRGWASTSMFVANTTSSTLSCNKDATYKNVLTMTGCSRDINNPQFSYDLLGTDCYNTLSHFVRDNNPERMAPSDWKEKFMFEPLGMKNSEWTGDGLACGSGGKFSCRDLARPAQLWMNNGLWKDESGRPYQLLDEEYAKTGSTHVFPNSDPGGDDPYGFGVRRRPLTDPVDPDVAYFGGAKTQCAFFSRRHNAIVVSMGDSFFPKCKTHVWEQSRNAIVSRDDPLWAVINANSTGVSVNKGSVALS